MDEKQNTDLRRKLDAAIDGIQFLSANEPITAPGIQRLLDGMSNATDVLSQHVKDAIGSCQISLWNPNVSYRQGDVVVWFKDGGDGGSSQKVFMLVSLKNGNSSIPNHVMVDGIPDFSESGWMLLNQTSYLLQDLQQMKDIVKEVFSELLERHMASAHGIQGSIDDIAQNLVAKDYSNLASGWRSGGNSLVNSPTVQTVGGHVFQSRPFTNGIVEYLVQYSFDGRANQDARIGKVVAKERSHYLGKSPIFDESDDTIFSRKYMEDASSMMVADVHPLFSEDGSMQGHLLRFNNLRYGTNVFFSTISFPQPFVDSEYAVFFDTYGNGEFVFAHGIGELEKKVEPTYDAVVSMPMMMDKSESGFRVVLPIHTYFNSIQKYRIGVPWNNLFRLRVVGRVR